MKFGAKLLDVSNITHFTNVVATLARLCAKAANDKSCVLKLTTESIYFILPEFSANGATHAGTGRTSFWLQVDPKSLFEFYVCEGKSLEEDFILLEIQPESLLRALKSSPNIKVVRIKLTKRQTPCITVELDLLSLNTTKLNSRTITHDMPVRIIAASKTSMDDFHEPKINRASLSIQLPPLKLLKHMLERMKCLSDFVSLEATSSGTLTLRIEADSVSVNTYFRNLVYLPTVDPSAATTSAAASEPAVSNCVVRLSLKRLTEFMGALQIQPTKMICNFVNKKYAHFFVIHDENLVLQYLISSVMN